MRKNTNGALKSSTAPGFTEFAPMHEALDNAGIQNVFYESQGTAHEFQTRRRERNDFTPRLFR